MKHSSLVSTENTIEQQFPRTRVMDVSRIPCGETNHGPLQEQVFLGAEPSLPPKIQESEPYEKSSQDFWRFFL